MPRRAQVIQQQVDSVHWEIALRRPAAHLQPYVLRELVGYSERSPGPLARREFPGPQVVMIIEFGPPIRICEPRDRRRAGRYVGGFVAGMHDTYALTQHEGFQRGLQLNFTPIGARLFFGLPMSELTGRVVHLADLLPRAHRSLAERLAALPTWDARFDLMEQLVSERIAASQALNDPVRWAFRRIQASGGKVDIHELAHELGYSRKHLVTLFREHIGVPPKLLACVVRFDRLMQHLKTGGLGSWAELALEFGYADQSHLVREVRRFTGATPTDARTMLVDLGALADDAAA